jgi:hypothetical protein
VTAVNKLLALLPRDRADIAVLTQCFLDIATVIVHILHDAASVFSVFRQLKEAVTGKGLSCAHRFFDCFKRAVFHEPARFQAVNTC